MTTIASGKQTEGDKPHWIEWVTGLVSTLLVLGMLGWVAYEAATRTSDNPDLSVSVTSTVTEGPGHRVEFTVANAATTTAAAVVVRGELVVGGEVADDVDVTFDYVPSQSSVDGAMMFTGNPADGELRLRAVGYTDP